MERPQHVLIHEEIAKFRHINTTRTFYYFNAYMTTLFGAKRIIQGTKYPFTFSTYTYVMQESHLRSFISDNLPSKMVFYDVIRVPCTGRANGRIFQPYHAWNLSLSCINGYTTKYMGLTIITHPFLH